MKLSIIIPAYNVEKYIDRCLESVLDQDLRLKDYEIIIVDDGSTDSTYTLITKWERECENIVVIKQQNFGLSVARNQGLNQAVGDYIFFIDSDDKIQPNILKKLVNVSEKNELDILRFNFFNSGQQNFYGEFNKLYCGINFFKFCEGIWSSWLQLFKREYLISNNFYFKRGITSEDIELMPKVYLSANRVMAVNVCVYYYMYNPSSITREKKFDIDRISKRISSQLDVLKSNTLLRNEFIEQPALIKTMDRTVIYPTFTDFCTMILLSKLPFRIAKQYQHQYIKSDLYVIRFSQQCTLKQKLMFSIINSSFLFNLYYFSGIKSIYYSYKSKYE